MHSGPSQGLNDSHYQARSQVYHHFNESGKWEPATPAITPVTASPSGTSINPKSLRLISWNIDVLVGFADQRMSAALQYLSSLVSSSPADVPIVIFLQEMSRSDMVQIRDSPWMKQRFYMADMDHTNWLSPMYGTTILVDNRLSVKSVFRVPFRSRFDRDGLFVDIALANTDKVLRLCNVHLESLVADPPIRPSQLAAAAEYLHAADVAAGLLAGDLNAIQPFDRTLHAENNLKDVYLELGGTEDSEQGYTWGPQAPTWMREKFGCSRMDKILMRGSVKPNNFERIGMGIKVAEEHEDEVGKAIEGAWVTDHYGVMGDFDLHDETQLASEIGQ